MSSTPVMAPTPLGLVRPQATTPRPGKLENYAHLLPYMIRLRGKPMTLERHYMMKPFYNTVLPWKMVMKAGRQVSKSVTLCGQSFTQSAFTSYLSTLFVLPLYESTRRLSGNVMKPMISESPIRGDILDSTCEQSVLQKTFANRSMMQFSFCFLDCDRIRGISADVLKADEVQDIDFDFFPVIRETLSASQDWGMEQFSGTPKTFDNTLEALWEDSSQAEWVIPCRACHHFNIPAAGYDIMGMIGPVSNISTYGTALVCAKCGKPIDARAGSWVHQHPDKYIQFAGYHIPQTIMPMHFQSEKKWTELIHKRDKTAPAKFLNECLGESCDVGAKLLTLTEIKRACVLHKMDWHTAKKTKFQDNYIQRILGVDWGGGGMEEISFTTLAVIGLRPDYKLELIWGERLHAAVDDVEEVRRIIETYWSFSCHFLAHDFAGSGSVHETLLIQSGFDIQRIIPFSYVATGGKNIITHHPPFQGSSRHFYSLDKTWSLMMLCTLVKTCHITFTDYETSKGLLDDFLNLIEDKTETRRAGDIMTIKRRPKHSDDFVHAINYACCGHFHTTQHYPDISKSFGLTLTEEQRQAAVPLTPRIQ
jgi:hypothetical protein